MPSTGLCLNNFLYWADVTPGSPNRVKQGDVLIQLDPTQAAADETVARNKLLSGRAEITKEVQP